ncbi:hypothetical protein ACFFLS_12285 [Flavobacterium procerum]|uniref:Uncharacterized protein n=1 Tax=Flavobacterium procerum TaxID=1455569 RepID=A0ABV6BUV6_9FLAO
MKRTIKNLTGYLAENPKRLFLIDSAGAFMTALLLFIILRHFSEYFGMPKTVLICLSAAAVSFSIYSVACFLLLKRTRTLFIKIIGIANLLYCVAVIGLVIQYRGLLTIMGTGYFLAETAVICALGFIELSAAEEIKKSGRQLNY